MVNPLANYYTKFYFGAVATLWATTFSFAVLFIPKVYVFYKQWKRAFVSSSTQQLRNNSACSDNTQQTVLNDDDTVAHSFLKSKNGAGHHAGITGEPFTSAVLSEQIGDTTIITRAYLGGEIEDINVLPTESNHRYDNTNVYVEVQEVKYFYTK